MHNNDFRLTTARNFLATAPESDFKKLLADVVDLADDYMATDLDETVSKVTTEGGVYLSPADFHRLCPTCLNRATEIVTTEAQAWTAPKTLSQR
jgi:hypothetical protein